MKGIRKNKNKDYCDVCGKVCKSINGQKSKEKKRKNIRVVTKFSKKDKGTDKCQFILCYS